MAQYDTFFVPFIGGMDTKSDAKALEAPALQVCRNGVFTERGSVKKRNGYTSVPNEDVDGDDIIGTPLAVAARDSELVMLTSRRIYSRNTGSNKWFEKGYYNPVKYSVDQVNCENTAQTYGDSASADGYTITAAADGLYVTDSTGALISGKLDVYADVPRRCVAIGSTLVAVGGTGATYSRVFRTYDIDNDIANATQNVIVGSDDHINEALIPYNSNYAVHAYVTNSKLYVCHITTSGTQINIREIASVSGALGVAASYNADTDCVAVVHTDSATTVNMYEFDASTLTLTGSASQTGGTAYVAPGVSPAGNGWICAFCDQDLSMKLSLRAQAFASETDSQTFFGRYWIAGYDHANDSIGYLVVLNTDSYGLQHSYYLVNSEGVFCGQLMYGEAADVFQHTAYDTGRGTSFAGGELILPFRRAVDYEGDNIEVFEDEGLRRVTFDHTAVPQTVVSDGVLYMTGSMLWAYDGMNMYPATMPYFPSLTDALISDSGVAASGSDPASGVQYNYRGYWEWRNARGHRIRSNAIVVSNTPGANQKQTLQVPALSATGINQPAFGTVSVKFPQSHVYFVPYRTEGNKSEFYYRLGSSSNSYSTQYLSYTDDTADSTLIGAEVDYKTRGELGDDPVSGASIIAMIGDRMFVAGGSLASNDILVSKPVADGDPVRFNSSFVITDGPQPGGDIRGIASLDGVPVIFKRRSIYALVGDGPDATGSSGSYTSRGITSDVGLEDIGVIAETPDGLIFKSSKGFYLLDTSYNVTYIGAQAEAYNSQTFKAAHVLPDSNTVVFVAASGETVIYDYYYKQWGTWGNHLGKSACVTDDGVYAYMRNDGRVYVADSSSYLDDGVNYSMKIKTAPVRPPTMIQGYWLIQRFQIAGDWLSNHKLNVGIYYDRELSPYETYSWDPGISPDVWGENATWGSGSYWGGDRDGLTYQHEHAPKRGKAQTVSFEFEDVPGDNPGAGYELTELAIRYRPWSGLARLPVSRQY